ncbi:uncharacterized protein TNCV_561711 [Trichonephila clavipes]|uniref:Transposase Tc1-like domain-containing protein n=1 Tax=Trichonephila clavipes TaxID=2585209 RepID=A0A8X6S1C7_TRICX|nr:uncharacterized protein TNCV_561711 [Trichonephila clavipes]
MIYSLNSSLEKPRVLLKSERSLKKICLENSFATTKLQDISVNASENTVRRKLQDLNFMTCRPARKPKLTLEMKAKRMNWAKQWRDKDVDFWRSSNAQFVRRRRGEKFHSDCVVQTVKHPTKIMIWPVISGKGTGRLYVVKGMMWQDQYKDVLQNCLIPLLEEWFQNGEPCIFMQEEAPCHTARSIKPFFDRIKYPSIGLAG